MKRRDFLAFTTAMAPGAALHGAAAASSPPEDEDRTGTPAFVNVQDFGAEPFYEGGDASAIAQKPDSTDAIQAAIDAADHGTVFIPRGQYRVTRPLTMEAGSVLAGDGPGNTVLTSEKAMSAVVHLRGVAGPMTVIRDMFFAGPLGGNWECDAIFLDGTNGIAIRDCWLAAWRRAVRIEGVSDHWLRDLVFELNQEGIVVRGGDGLGRWHENLRLLNCYGYQNYQGAIRIENVRGIQADSCSSVGSAYFLWLRNCANATVTGASVNWDGSPWAKYGVLLEDCSLVAMHGCNIEGPPEYGLRASNSKRLTLQGNMVSHVRNGPGIHLESCAQSSLADNVVAHTASHGIQVASCQGTIVRGNIVSDFAEGEGATGSGIYTSDNASDCLIDGNLIS